MTDLPGWRAYRRRRRVRWLLAWSIPAALFGAWLAGLSGAAFFAFAAAMFVWIFMHNRSPADPGWRCIWAGIVTHPETGATCWKSGPCHCMRSLAVEQRIAQGE